MFPQGITTYEAQLTAYRTQVQGLMAARGIPLGRLNETSIERGFRRGKSAENLFDDLVRVLGGKT